MRPKFILTTPEELRELVTEIIRSETPKVPESAKTEDLISRKEAARLLSITLPTLWDWTRKGTIPGYRISKRVYYKRHEIEAALKSMHIRGRKEGQRK
jgi:excisionase family DNA binding protein